MELQTMKTVRVTTFDEKHGYIQVRVPVEDGSFQAGKVFQAVSDSIGLKDSSHAFFRLFEGLLAPVRCFSPAHCVPEDVCDLSLQRWCFSSETEVKVASHDDVALQLLFLQAQVWVEHGWVELSEADLAKLEEYLDPAFTLPGQYLKQCHKSDGYHSYQFSQCSVEYRNQDINHSLICRDDLCTVVLNLKSLNIKSGGKTHVYQWPHVKSWQLWPDKRQVRVDVAPLDMSPSTVTISTQQCHFMVDVINAVITQIQKAIPGSASFHVSMVKTADDGSTSWENALFVGRT